MVVIFFLFLDAPATPQGDHKLFVIVHCTGAGIYITDPNFNALKFIVMINLTIAFIIPLPPFHFTTINFYRYVITLFFVSHNPILIIMNYSKQGA